MKKLICVLILGVFHMKVYSQFNTIRMVKKLPKVQVDTVFDYPEEVNNTPTLEPNMRKEFKKKAGTSFSMPLSMPVINSPYGSRIDPITGKVNFHQGIDFKGVSDSVIAIMPGEVKKVDYSRGLGNYIEVEHGDFRTTYGHLSFVMVREKTRVDAGTVIGITGSTGRSTGDHLHFSIKYKGRNINPTPFLDIIYQTIEYQARKNIDSK